MADKPERTDLAWLLQELQAVYPAYGCVSTAPAEKWDFGAVSGNGVQGALAFCRTRDEELVLSHEELFLPLFPFSGYLPVKGQFETFRQMVMEGRAQEVQERLRAMKIEGDFPHYNTTDPFVGAASLRLRMRNPDRYQAYLRSVDFASGEVLTAWKDATGLIHRRFFVSRADDVLVLRLSSPLGSALNLSIALGEIDYVPPTDPKEHNIYEKTIDRCVGTASETGLSHRMVFKQRCPGQPVKGSCTAARVVRRGGTAQVAGRHVEISGAEEILLLVKTVPDRRESPVWPDRVREELAGLEPDYDALLQAHAVIHAELFNRCSLELSSKGESLLSGEELLARSGVGHTLPALVEKTFQGGRYGIISSTGRMPPALQGVWTGTWKPRWSGDYTLNGNVQSMVAASLCANHYECMESLLAYLDSLKNDFRENARQLLGFRGLLIPWRSSTHGRTHYLAYKQYHHDFPGVFWFAGAAWFAQCYYDYYLHSGDESFFETRLKPFVLEAAAFYEDYLSVERDGTFVLTPCSSPENQIAPNISIAPNATMTIAAIKQLLRTLLRLQGKLGVDAEQVRCWEEMLRKLPAYQVGANGALKEWAWPGIENEEEHRHASHLYPLYDGMDPEIAASTPLKEACRVAIDKRMACRRPENGGFMAFGFTQMGLAAAHLGDSALAYECLEYLANAYWSPMMVSQHNNRDVLNVDISGGLPAVIIAMLIQSSVPEDAGSPWLIRLLPCLPEAWSKGRLRGVRCRGGFEVDIRWAEGRLTEVRISSLRGEACRVAYERCRVDLAFRRGEERRLGANLLDLSGRGQRVP